MPRFKCPKCGREKIIMTEKVKWCSRCNEKFVPVETVEKKSKKKKKSETLPSASGAAIERAEP